MTADKLTDGRALEKRFSQWRAGLLVDQNPADVERDVERFLNACVIVDMSGVGALPPARPLSVAERLIKRQGREISLRPLEIMRRTEVYAEQQASRTARDRTRRLVKAEKARAQARLAEAEAARWE
jgi:hypothetical protein